MRAALVSVLAVVFVLGAGALWADEETIPLDKVPKAVMEAVKKRFPKDEPKEASKETTDGKTVYELTLKADGKNIDVTVTAEGVITTIEKEIAAKDLPAAVSEALEKKYAKATYSMVEEVIKVADGKETLEYYEVLLTAADKKMWEVEILADGKIKAETEKKDEKKGDEKKVEKKDKK